MPVLPPEDKLNGKPQITRFRSGQVRPLGSLCFQLRGAQAATIRVPRGQRVSPGCGEEPERRAEGSAGAAAGKRVRGPCAAGTTLLPVERCSYEAYPVLVNLGEMLRSR